MIDISIIIVNWNTEKLLIDCIQTLLNFQGGYSVEVIVVDNASKDNSISSLREFFHDVIIIQNSQNLGFAKANNQGMQVAKGRYLALVNSDIKFIEDCLNPMLTYMDQHLDVGVAGPKLLSNDKTLQLSCRMFPSLWNTLCPAVGLTTLFPKSAKFSGEHMGYFLHDRVSQVDVVVGAFLMIRREAYLSVGGMDENYFMYCEEVDWCKRLSKAGWKVVFLPQAQVIHYGGGSSSKEPMRFYRELYLSNLKYWKKYHSDFEVLLYRIIFFLRQIVRLPPRYLTYLASRCLKNKEKQDYYLKKIQQIRSSMKAVFEHTVF